MRFKLLLFVCLLFSCVSYSALAQQNLEYQVDLSVKPIACIVKHAGQACQMTITVNWLSDKPVDACLYQDNKKLHCWQQKQAIKQTFDIELAKDMLFLLQSSDKKLLAQQLVRLNKSVPVKQRRRLRAEWSLF